MNIGEEQEVIINEPLGEQSEASSPHREAPVTRLAATSNPPSEVLEVADLEAALGAARGRAEWAAQRAKEYEHEAQASQREVELLKGVIALRRGEVPGDGFDDSRHDLRDRTAGGPQELVAGGEFTPLRVTDAAVRALEDAGKPMHITQLMLAVKEMGAVIPGSGTQANLISHLRRDPRIVRPSRGLYALKVWGMEEYKPETRKKRSRKRARGKARK